MKTLFFPASQFLLVVCLGLAACAPQPTSVPDSTAVIFSTNTVALLNTGISTATVAPILEPTEAKNAATSEPDATVAPTATITPVYVGTPAATSGEIIGLDNLTRLAKVAQWGRGSIRGVAFSPDGNFFVAGTNLGWAIYDMKSIDSPPGWVPFDEITGYSQIYFSADGQNVLLKGSPSDVVIRSFPDGKVTKTQGTTWLMPVIQADYSNRKVKSFDGEKEFQSNFMYEFNETLFTEEMVERKMYDSKGNLLYRMSDDIPYITYRDRMEPEGCDLGVFSPCGNALMSLAMAPADVNFSPSGDTFAILYNVPSLWNSKSFSFLRVYNSADGKFIMATGGRENPVSDFAYAPNSKTIGVAYLDGSVRLWDIGSNKPRFGARHMNADIDAVAYSADGKFLLVQRNSELEVRRTRDGFMSSRFNISTFSVSPVDNLVAMGDSNGLVRVSRIDTGKTVISFQAHEDLIYSVAFSADGRYIASGGRDCNIKLWDAKTGKLLHYFEETKIDAYDLGKNSRIFAYHMEFIPDTDTVVGFGSWGTAVAWSINSGATKYIIQSPALEYYDGMQTLKPHFPEFFSVDVEHNTFYINEAGFDITTGQRSEQTLPNQPSPDGCAPVGPVSRDGNLLFTRGYEEHEGEICILDARAKTLLGTFLVIESSPNQYLVGWPYLSPDGKQLIVTTELGLIYVYQVSY